MPAANCSSCGEQNNYRMSRGERLAERACEYCRQVGTLKMQPSRRRVMISKADDRPKRAYRKKPKEPHVSNIVRPKNNWHEALRQRIKDSQYVRVVRTATAWAVQYSIGPIHRRSTRQWPSKEEAQRAIETSEYL